MRVSQRKRGDSLDFVCPTDQRARVVELIVDFPCSERWILEGPRGSCLRGVMPMTRATDETPDAALR
jgi:hypothetical protein